MTLIFMLLPNRRNILCQVAIEQDTDHHVIHQENEISLILVTALLIDRSLHHFLFIGSFAIQEHTVYEDHPM